jgi:hypothetical protein
VNESEKVSNNLPDASVGFSVLGVHRERYTPGILIEVGWSVVVSLDTHTNIGSR